MSHKLFLSGHAQQSDSVKATAGQGSSDILVILDSKVSAPSSLMAGIAADSHVVVLDDTRDGVAQITELLQQHRHVAQVHLISHGAPGSLYLGNGELSLDTLEAQREELRGWFAEADQVPSLLIYGCNVAAGDAGSEFLEKLHGLTGAAIAASKTRTGNADKGGDWNLEVTLGEPVVELAIAPEVQATYAGVFAPLDQGDYDALRALFESTGGASWTNNTGWDFSSSTPPDSSVVATWFGVTVDENTERVTKIILGVDATNPDSVTGNNLVGTLPPELANLTALEELKIAGNEGLVGRIPSELGQITSLTRLWLHDNKLSGSIPKELGNLPELFWLRLAGNDLTGEIPAELGNLSNLTLLQLFSNELSGSIPAELGQLTKLTSFGLADNQLSGSIPAELANLPSVSSFGLSSNLLSGDVPEALTTLLSQINEGAPNPATVSLDNRPFIVSKIDDRTVAVNSGTLDISGISIGDIDQLDNSTQTLSVVNVTSSDPNIATVAQPSGTPGSQTISITPVQDATGIVTISVEISDGGTETAIETFEVIVGDVPTAPSISINALTITEGETVVLSNANLAATDPNDREPNELTFMISDVTGGQFELVANPGNAVTTFTQQQVNEGAVQFVHDGGDVAPAYSIMVADPDQQMSGASAVQPTFTSVNDAPSAIAFGNPVNSAPANQDTTNGFKLADVNVTDDPGSGTLVFTVNGNGSELFEVVTPDGANAPILQVKPGATLTEDTTYNLTVGVDDPTIGEANSVELTSQTFAFAVDEAIPPVPDDFNGDRISDILFRNTETGAKTLVLSNGASEPTLANYGPFIKDTNWQIQAVGNFNSDNVADIVWSNVATGQNVIWQGGSAQGENATVGSAWVLQSVTDKSWTIKGAGNFDDDDFSEILWYNESTDKLVAWSVNTDPAVNSVDAVELNVGDISGQTLEATGDFDSDGDYDLLFSDAQGALSIQFMDGVTASGGLRPVIDGAEGPQLSKPAGTETIGTGSISLGQINQNFIAFRSADGSTNTAWFMDARTRTSEGTLPGDTALSQFDSAWQAIV